MRQLIKSQCNVLMHQKGVIICMLIHFTAVCVNFLYNVIRFWNVEQADMYSFLEISTLSASNPIGWYLVEFFAFLIVLPGGFSFMKDRNTREDILWIGRCGRKRYIISRIIAVGMITFFCFFLPLMMELVLNLIAFPYFAHGNLMGYPLYEEEYQVIQQYFLFSLYYNHPACYAIIMSIGISLMAALLSMIPLMFSFYIKEYYANLMVPLYLLLNIIDKTNFRIFGMRFQHDYAAYIQWCRSGVNLESMVLFGGMIIAFAGISCVVMLHHAGKDVL